MNYQDISKVNSEMTMLPIEKRNQKTGEITKKDYAMVPERVTAFRKLIPGGFILTDIVNVDGPTVTMQTRVGYYDDNGNPVLLATGLAQETKGQGLVNGTSHIENCETSSVGRALGFLGLGIEGGGGICSAEELANAITGQKQLQEKSKQAAADRTRPESPKRIDTPADVEKIDKVPDIQKLEKLKPEPTDAQVILLRYLKESREKNGLTPVQNNKLFASKREALVRAGLAPDKKIELYTVDEANSLIEAMEKNFADDAGINEK